MLLGLLRDGAKLKKKKNAYITFNSGDFVLHLGELFTGVFNLFIYFL